MPRLPYSRAVNTMSAGVEHWELRDVSQEDSKDILAIANDPAVRAMFFSTSPIGVEEHIAWFSKRLPSCCFCACYSRPLLPMPPVSRRHSAPTPPACRDMRNRIFCRQREAHNAKRTFGPAWPLSRRTVGCLPQIKIAP